MAIRVLSKIEVAQIVSRLTISELVENQAAVFRAVSSTSTPELQIQCPPRLTLSLPVHSTLIMPARVTGTGAALKVVSVPTGSDAPPGLPASTMVFDERSGALRGVVNATNLTPVRNAAGSLLATRLLLGADATPQRVVALGSGAQIRAHLDILVQAYSSINRLTIINRSLGWRTESLRHHIAESPIYAARGLSAERVALDLCTSSDTATTESALRSADIIICATSSSHPLFPSAWVKSGAHIILIGSYTPAMHEVPDELIHRAGKVVVDSRDACVEEAGELISAGFTSPDQQEKRLIEVGMLIDNQDLLKTIHEAGDITIFKSVGIAAQDVAIACLVFSRAEELGYGTLVPFDD